MDDKTKKKCKARASKYLKAAGVKAPRSLKKAKKK